MNKSLDDENKRSNTDKTKEKLHTDPIPKEPKKKKAKKPKKKENSESFVFENSKEDDSESKVESESHNKLIIPESKFKDNWEFYEFDLLNELDYFLESVKVIWEVFEFELKVEFDLFCELNVPCPHTYTVFRPIMADSIVDVKDDRDTLIHKVKAIQLILDNHALVPPALAVPISKEYVDLKIEDLHSAKIGLDQIQKRTRKVYRGEPPADLNLAITENDGLLVIIENALLQAHKIKHDLQTQVISRVKIPKADPPSFDGKSTNWPAFLDQFNSMVVSNTQVSPTDKLALLKKSLEKGTAHHIVQNFPLTDLDWTNAWAAVMSRYNHKREMAYAHLSKLFDLSPIQYQSSNAIRNIIDTVNEVILALKNQKLETDKWDLIIIFIIRKNLDIRTRTDFEKLLPNDDLHSLQVLLDYLNTLATALSTAGIHEKAPKIKEIKENKTTKLEIKEEPTSSKGSGDVSESQSKKNACVFCKQQHLNSKCPSLVPLTPHQRIKLAVEKRLCKNCLKSFHKSYKCKEAPCGLNGCEFKHHSLLHIEPKAEVNSTTIKNLKTEEISQDILSTASVPSLNVLLSTAIVNIIVDNVSHKVRVLIDQGSQVNLMTEKLANMLKLKRKSSSISINGMGNLKPNCAKGYISVGMQSRVEPDWKIHIGCYVLSELTGEKPSHCYDLNAVQKFNKLKLADETFNIPGQVEMILGAQVFIDILGELHFKGFPSALDTKLGYVITGAIDSNDTEIKSTLTCDVNFDLSRFWTQEEVPQEMKLSPEEQEAEDNFVLSHVQSSNGKFTVGLPFKSDFKILGESKFQAERRLNQIERKLEKFPERKKMYHSAMNDYITEGYVTEIPCQDILKSTGSTFYLPHHFVEKDSTTTKFRVVFDGSAKTTNGVSLNDNLLIGPCIQNDLFKILLRFREHAVVFSSDIRKMYLQIGIQESDQDYHRFLWRCDTKEKIKEYKYTVIPFGLSSSPFLAIRTLHQLARNQSEKYPMGSESLLNDFYVDDCLSGAKDTKSALEKQKELSRLLSSGQFELRKWSRNCSELLNSIPEDQRETQLPLEIESTNKVKTLGVLWNPATDNFTFKVVIPTQTTFTKRLVASYAAKTYDPTGLIQPVIIKAKIVLQELWESKTGWDEVIPEEIDKKWQKYLKELPDLENLQISRHVMPNNPDKLIVHGFSDASKKAYGAVIFIVGFVADQVSSHLFTAKSKVTPLKLVTIPRLELMGAVMVTKLMKTVLKTCRSKFDEIHYWSDSSVVLNQVNKPSRSFKTFVGNRVSYIQENSDQDSWHYVKSSENPADLVSRGVCPAELNKNKLWWHGPDWLKLRQVPIQPIPSCSKDTDLEENTKLSSLSAGLLD